MEKKIALAMTGASGVIYGVRTVAALLARGCRIDLTLSPAAREVLAEEMGVTLGSPPALADLWPHPSGLTYYPPTQVAAPMASGSNRYDAYIVVPCSTGSMGRIASGTSDNLVGRMAEVALKERRPLILVPRESPYSTIMLENMTRLSRAGAIILPASPGFYHHPSDINELVDFVVGRILSHLGFSDRPGPAGWTPKAP
ncbi:UbiX family flavin prenyltransferase [bacterium]|nr:UbiX family flavin prenyltransferase [bacterium]